MVEGHRKEKWGKWGVEQHGEQMDALKELPVILKIPSEHPAQK